MSEEEKWTFAALKEYYDRTLKETGLRYELWFSASRELVESNMRQSRRDLEVLSDRTDSAITTLTERTELQLSSLARTTDERLNVIETKYSAITTAHGEQIATNVARVAALEGTRQGSMSSVTAIVSVLALVTTIVLGAINFIIVMSHISAEKGEEQKENRATYNNNNNGQQQEQPRTTPKR